MCAVVQDKWHARKQAEKCSGSWSDRLSWKVCREGFQEQGDYVRVLTRNERRLRETGPFTAPALTKNDYEEMCSWGRPPNLKPLL